MQQATGIDGAAEPESARGNVTVGANNAAAQLAAAESAIEADAIAAAVDNGGGRKRKHSGMLLTRAGPTVSPTPGLPFQSELEAAKRNLYNLQEKTRKVISYSVGKLRNVTSIADHFWQTRNATADVMDTFELQLKAQSDQFELQLKAERLQSQQKLNAANDATRRAKRNHWYHLEGLRDHLDEVLGDEVEEIQPILKNAKLDYREEFEKLRVILDEVIADNMDLLQFADNSAE